MRIVVLGGTACKGPHAIARLAQVGYWSFDDTAEDRVLVESR